MDSLQTIFQTITAVYQNSVIFKVVFGLIFLFLLLFIYLLVDLSIKRSFNRNHEKLKKELEDHFSELIINYLVSSQSPKEFVEKNFPQQLTNSERIFFTEILMNLAKNLEGDTKDKIKLIFKYLELHDEVQIQLNSKDIHKIVNAISTLSALGLGHEFIGELRLLSKNKNMEIRKAANKLLILLIDFKHLKVLSKTRNEITDFEQIMIINELVKKTNIIIPDLKELFLTQSNSYLVLLLKVCKVFRLTQYESNTIQLIKSKSPEVKIQALKNMIYFGYSKEKQLVQSFLNSKNIHLKHAAWQYLIEFGIVKANLNDFNYYNTLSVESQTNTSEFTYSIKRTRLLDIMVTFLVIISVPIIVLSSEFIYHYQRGEIKSLEDFRLDLLHDIGIDDVEEVDPEKFQYNDNGLQKSKKK